MTNCRFADRVEPVRPKADQHPGMVGQHGRNLQLEDRYAKKSVIMVSQLPVAKWYEYINDPTLADAILDRLSAGAIRIELKGASLRNRKS